MAASKTKTWPLLLGLAAVWFLSAACTEKGFTPGLVVVSCIHGEAADVAGLIPGDVVSEWRHGKAGGEATSPFHLAMVEQELAPYGPVELVVRRERHRLLVTIPIGRWGLHLRPGLDPPLSDNLLRAQLATDIDDFSTAASVWEDLARSTAEGGRGMAAAWFHIQAIAARTRLERESEPLADLQNAAELIEDPRIRAAYWERAGDLLFTIGQTAAAGGAFRTTIKIYEEEAPSSPAMAFALLQLCRCNYRMCGDEATRALNIYRKAGSETIEVATALNILATRAFYRSNLDEAERCYSNALRVAEAITTGSPTEGNLLGNLGLVAKRRGDFDTARAFFRRQMATAELLGADSIQYAYAANYSGLLAKQLGRYDEARLYFEKALVGFKSIRPGGVEVAGMLTNLGNLALVQNDLETARHAHQEALDLRRNLDPDSSDAAASLHNLGTVFRRQEKIDDARTLLEEALALKTRLSPNSIWVATTFSELGEVALLSDRLEEARDHHLRALEIRRLVAPDHPDVAASLIQLGIVENAAGRLDVAEQRWQESVALIEDQRLQHDITEEQRSQFKAQYRTAYHRLAELLIDRRRPEEAWNLLEQSRAGALRAMVSRRVNQPAGVSSDLWFAKSRAETRVARLESRIARIDPDTGRDDLLELRRRLASVQNESKEIVEKIHQEAPQFSELETPPAMSLAKLRRELDSGTVVLAYSIGKEHSLALITGAAVDGGQVIQTFDVAMGSSELAGRVDRFNSLIARGRTVAEIEAPLVTQAQRLFELLVGPASEVIAAAERVLIVPDGPLLELPFSALMFSDDSRRFLGHTTALFVNPSASLAVELGAENGRHDHRSRTIAAFGDPDYPVSSAVVEEHRLRPLPGSRTEIEAIGRLFGTRAAVFLGAAATKANLMGNTGGADILHCAVHARLDPWVSMDSALFFSQPSDPTHSIDDGVLTAWEIADGLGTNAELVVLSACDTAHGRIIPGEGIIGLARAFQVAGARTMVVSQWAVPDRSTADLMIAFYERLGQGDSTADALQRAQQRVGDDPEFAHPYFWASFQVRGDWN